MRTGPRTVQELALVMQEGARPGLSSTWSNSKANAALSPQPVLTAEDRLQIYLQAPFLSPTCKQVEEEPAPGQPGCGNPRSEPSYPGRVPVLPSSKRSPFWEQHPRAVHRVGDTEIRKEIKAHSVEMACPGVHRMSGEARHLWRPVLGGPISCHYRDSALALPCGPFLSLPTQKDWPCLATGDPEKKDPWEQG